MKLRHIFRFVAASSAAVVGAAIGCGGATATDLLDPAGDGSVIPGNPDGPGPADTGRDTGRDSSTGDSGGNGNDSGSDPIEVRCGMTEEQVCSAPTRQCCVTRPAIGFPSYACAAIGTDCRSGSGNTRLRVECDNDDDCGQGNRCCGHRNNNDRLIEVVCEPQCTGGNTVRMCTDEDQCPSSAGRCSGQDSDFPDYRYCVR